MKRPAGAEPLEFQRSLRLFSTDAEKIMWSRLRSRQVAGCKFRRQVWIGHYIVDFVCLDKKLVIEADGGQHAEQQDYDQRRTMCLERQGYRVMRFWNNDVVSNIDGVVQMIAIALEGHEPSPSHPAAPGGPLPLPQGERRF